MIINRSNNIYDELPKFNVIHGCGVNNFRNDEYIVPFVSKDIKVVMISNFRHQSSFPEQYENSDRLDFTFIELPTFKCWIDKIEPLLNLAKSIDNKYIMYLDTSDTVLLTNLLDPKSLLDKYKCKVLFNAEDDYSNPGHPCDPKLWLNDYPTYYKDKDAVIIKNKSNLASKMNTNGFTRSLNAGVFLGEREFLIEVLQKILDLMNDDPSKGYPYGESDDQVLWQHMMSLYENNEIEIDYYNLFFLWTHSRKFDFPHDHWEHFNYFNNIN
jgi:hypothetical protein